MYYIILSFSYYYVIYHLYSGYNQIKKEIKKLKAKNEILETNKMLEELH